MDQFSALVKKELRIYFNSPIAYIFLVAFLALSSWFFFRGFFLVGQTEMRSFFALLPWIFLFLIPAMTMRLWAEEFRQGTIETLLTSSVSLMQSVMAKALGGTIFLIIALLLTLPLAFTLNLIGNLDWGVVIAAYIGALFLGMAYIALGLFLSAITSNQIVAFILSVMIMFTFFILGEQIVVYAMPGSVSSVFEFIGLGAHYHSMSRGVIDTRDIIYYLSFIGLFLFLNMQVLKTKK